MAKQSGNKQGSKNDQRSDVKNPNSDAYKADRDNRVSEQHPNPPPPPDTKEADK